METIERKQPHVDDIAYWLYMGNTLLFGREGAIKNPEKARYWFEMAAEAGSKEAVEMLKAHYGPNTVCGGEDNEMAKKRKTATAKEEQDAAKGSAAENLMKWLESESAHQKNMMPLSLEDELALCREYAEQGYRLAQENYEQLRKDCADMKQRLEEANQAQDKLSRIENEKLIDEQMREINHLEASVYKICKNIDLLRDRQKDFSVVLYGRTEAGKSTLMEILTHGDGKSIGKGGQRTTLDVRDYYWQGLKITDVPGTCSFGGKEDDDLALDAAKSADMAIFLLTDDAPQDEEAQRLAELRCLGKPVLGILNVKQTLHPLSEGETRRRIDLKAIKRKVKDRKNLDSKVKQFQEFAKIYKQDFSDIPFVYAHLQAAYYSQEDRENDALLYDLSHFADVEQFILEKVRKDGKFIRIKTFVDSVALPMQNTITEIFNHSTETARTALSFDEKLHQLDKWNNRFRKRVQERFDTFMERLRSRINDEINSFVDTHYRDEPEERETAWKNRIQALHLDRECDIFIRKLSGEATKKMRDLSDELTQNLHYLGSSMPNIDISISVSDFTDYGDWIRTLALGAFLLGPLGWLGLGVTFLGSLFFDSDSDKIRKAKRELREKLENNRDEILSKIREGMLKILNEKILGEQIAGFRDTLVNMKQMLIALASRQSIAARIINERYQALNASLLKVAVQYIGSHFDTKKTRIARIVGQDFLVLSQTGFSEAESKELSALLGERVISVVSASKKRADRKRAMEDVIQVKCKWKKLFESIVVLELPQGHDTLETQRDLMQQMMDAPLV